MSRRSQHITPLLAALGLLACLAAPARAQTAPDPNPGNLTFVGGIDFTNAYMFRGIHQDHTRLIAQPYGEIDIGLQSADTGLKSTSLNIGTWNSLHTGDAGLRSGTSGFGCACGKLWYESDFYATLALGFSKAAFGITYTAYTSPNAGFNNVKEISFKLSGDDSAALGKAAMHPYAVVATEFDADGGHQADGGSKAGKYLELGVAPGYSGAKAGIAVPVKVGLSLGDYYELNVGTPARPVFEDNRFGFFSIAGIATVPINGTTSYGAWNFHAGVEFQKLGTTTEAFNGSDHRTIVSAGIGVTY
jgi:hypothetical protein